MGREAALRPSAFATAIVCSGSVAFRAAFPDAPEEADNEVCEDGTACHWLAHERWEGRSPQEGTLAPNGRVLTEEMFDAVDEYHDALNDPAWKDGETYCEREVDCSIIYPKMKGTPDAQTYAKRGAMHWLRIADLKFGFRFVEVWGNIQLIIYAIAVANKLGLPIDKTMVELVIIQPRSYHRGGNVRKWQIPLSTLHAEYLPMLREAAIRAMQPDARCTPNPGCVDCPGAITATCEALWNSALTALEVSSSSALMNPTTQQMGDALRRLEAGSKRMEALIGGLKTQVEHTLRAGGTVPGYELATAYAREGWREGGNEAIIALGQLLGKNVSKPIKALTPNQVRKQIPANLVAYYAHKPSTGVRLQQTDPNAARKKFGATPITLPNVGDDDAT